VSTTDDKGRTRNLVDIFSDISKKSAGRNDRLALFKSIAGQEAIGGFASLIGAASTAEGYKKLTLVQNSFDKVNGSAEKMAQVMGDNLSGDMKALSSAFDGLSITLSDSVDGELRKATKGLTSLIQKSTNFFSENKDFANLFSKVGSTLAGVIGGAGLFLTGLASFKATLATITSALGVLGVSVSAGALAPLALGVAGAGAIGGLGAYFWDDIKSGYKNYVGQAGKTLQRGSVGQLSTIQRSNTVNAPINITIEGSGDPQEVAFETVNVFEEFLKNVERQREGSLIDL